jgi:hypothetical protein
MRTMIGIAVLLAACGADKRREGNGPDGGDGDSSVCKTSLSGTVFAPNGTLPLYGVNVYVPTTDVGDIPDGLQCTKCSDTLPGNPVAQTLSNEGGHFEIDNVPPGKNIPLVITIGKWRRVINIPELAPCQALALDSTDTSLPKSHDDLTTNTSRVDMPKIAISTGSADSMECLVRRLGIADKEIGTANESGYVHLYSDLESDGVGVSKFVGGMDGGHAFADSSTLWGTATDPGTLGKYDIVLLSCEGEQYANTKPQAAMDHLKAYADAGGRVFLSHWQDVWLEGSTSDTTNGTQRPSGWTDIATFDDMGIAPGDPAIDTIDETNNPKGQSFATWMLDPGVGGSASRDQILVHSARANAKSVDNTKAERWVNLIGATSIQPQMFQFTTPNEAPAEQRCGKVVFSDMHVSGDSGADLGDYPASCGASMAMSAQEKALAFMFFDISSCVGPIF